MPLMLRNYEDYALKKTVIKEIKRQGKFHKRTYFYDLLNFKTASS